MSPKLQLKKNSAPTSEARTKADQICEQEDRVRRGEKLFAIMDEENNNIDDTTHQAHQAHQYASDVRGQYLEARGEGQQTSRSSSALSSSEGDEELESSASSGARSNDGEKGGYISSSSTSGAEDSSRDASLTPEPVGQLEGQQVAQQLNVHPNLIPETREANECVNAVRLKFLEGLDATKEQQALELYEESDLRELRKELPPPERQEQSMAFRLISRFLHLDQLRSGQLSDKELLDAVEKLTDFLQLRRQFHVPLIRSDEFCKEIYLLHGIFPFGYDKQQLPVLYLRAYVHRRWSQKFDESFRRYVFWQIDLITKSYAGAKVEKTVGRNRIEKDGSFGICFDCLNVSYSCLDMDFLRFLVRLLVNCYPTYCRYALCVDLPWLFRSVWKLVRSWLPEEAQNTVQLITSKQLTEYIDEQQIPNSIRTGSTETGKRTFSEKRKHKLPENFESIRNFDEFAKELGLNSSEVKSFKTHLEKVLKEYRQLGAI